MNDVPGFTPIVAPTAEELASFKLPDDVPSRADVLAALSPRERFALLRAEMAAQTRTSASVAVAEAWARSVAPTNASPAQAGLQQPQADETIESIEARIARLAEE